MEQVTLTHLVALGTIAKMEHVQRFLQSKTYDCQGCPRDYDWCPTCLAVRIVQKCLEATRDQHLVNCILEYDDTEEVI